MKRFFWVLALCCLMNQGCGGDSSSGDAALIANQDSVPLEVAEPRVVIDILPGIAPSDVTLLTEFKGKAYFFAVSNLTAGSRELWVSDGTAEGTTEITQEPNEDFTFQTLREMVATDEHLFFSIDPTGLWVSDGTTEGTHVLLSYDLDGLVKFENLTVVDNMLFFTVLGHQLWRSDGTLAGTALVKEVNSGASADFSELTAVGNLLFFSADDGIHGRELWTSDGTPEGTWLFKDFSSMDDSFPPAQFRAIGNILYFSADDGVHGHEPWRSDGTPSGTWMIADINEGDRTYLSSGFVEFENRIYFNAFNEGVGYTIWSTNGLEPEARILNNNSVDTTSRTSVRSSPCSGILPLFGEDLEHGYELWRTDGTDEGTVLTKDINPGSWSSTPHEMTCFQDKLYFAAYNPDFIGEELMVSDGTSEGTYLFKDIEPYTAPICDDGSSEPDSFTLVGDNQLFFTAEDCTNGRELWVMEAIPAN